MAAGATREVDLLVCHTTEEYRLLDAVGSSAKIATDEQLALFAEDFSRPDGLVAGYRAAMPHAPVFDVYLAFSAISYSASTATDSSGFTPKPAVGHSSRASIVGAPARTGSYGPGTVRTSPSRTRAGHRSTTPPPRPRCGALRTTPPMTGPPLFVLFGSRPTFQSCLRESGNHFGTLKAQAVTQRALKKQRNRPASCTCWRTGTGSGAPRVPSPHPAGRAVVCSALTAPQAGAMAGRKRQRCRRGR